MVNPSNSDSRVPPKPSNVQRDDKDRPPPYTRKDFKQTMREEDDRRTRQGQERTTNEKKERKQHGSPMSLAKNNPRTGEKSSRPTSKPTDKHEEISEDADADALAQEEGEEAQAQTKAQLAQAKTEQKAPNSPFSLFQKRSAKEKGETTLASLDKGSPRKEKSSSEGGRTDQSGINPMSGPGASIASIGTSIESKQQSKVAEIQALVDQIVDKLYVAQKGGDVNTTLVLKHPPIFEGASVVLISSKTAGKELNITFENLRPDAKALIDSNLQALRTGLGDKGVVVHLITATTQTEHLPSAGNQPPPSRDQRDQQQQRQDRQRDDQQPDDEE